MRDRIKSWLSDRWTRLISAIVVNQVLVQPVAYLPKGIVCQQCIQLDAMRLGVEGKCPIGMGDTGDVLKSGESPSTADTEHWSGCECSDCTNDRLDRFQHVKELVFDLFGFTWHTEKAGD